MQLKVDEKQSGREWTITLNDLEACNLTERLMKAEFGDARLIILEGCLFSKELRSKLLNALREEEKYILLAILEQRFALNMSTSFIDIEAAIKALL